MSINIADIALTGFEQMQRNIEKEERREQIERINAGVEPWPGYKQFKKMAYQFQQGHERLERGVDEEDEFNGEFDVRGGGESEEEEEAATQEDLIGGSDLDTDDEDHRHYKQMGKSFVSE